MKTAAAILTGLLAAVAPARGLVVSGDQTGHDTATGAGPGWDYVGNIAVAGHYGTGVYLGQYGGQSWVLTANHVGAEMNEHTNFTFTLAAQSYGCVPGTSTQVGGTDLCVFQINGAPAGLANLTLASTTPAAGASVTLIAAGRDRSDFTTWYVDTNSWSWSTNQFDGWDAIAQGYQTVDTKKKRWGTNSVTGSATISYGYTVNSIYTTFDNQPGETQGVGADSGGGVFLNDGTLAGILVTVDMYRKQYEQLGWTAAYGNKTYAADIAQYRDDILAVIPEPSALSLTLLALPLFLRRRR